MRLPPHVTLTLTQEGIGAPVGVASILPVQLTSSTQRPPSRIDVVRLRLNFCGLQRETRLISLA